MGQIMLNAINIEGHSKEQIQEAYNYLYDEYGYEVNFWEKKVFIKEVIEYWKNKK